MAQPSRGPESVMIPPSVDSEEVIERVIRARKGAGLEREDLKDALGVSYETISRMERGEHPLTVERLRAIAQICDVSYEWLMGETDDQRSEAERLRTRVDTLEQMLDEERRAAARAIAEADRLRERLGEDVNSPDSSRG